jgi:hypothetical protein
MTTTLPLASIAPTTAIALKPNFGLKSTSYVLPVFDHTFVDYQRLVKHASSMK